jgi:hypothetical protein
MRKLLALALLALALIGVYNLEKPAPAGACPGRYLLTPPPPTGALTCAS